VAGNVLEEAPLGSSFPKDAGDIGPKVAFVIRSKTLSGGAERLARVARTDEVDMPAPRITDECSQVGPHRGGVERSGIPSGEGRIDLNRRITSIESRT